jgi:hypothetical protein
MKINPYSKNRFYNTFDQWRVPKDYAEPMLNYLYFGFNPGSFFTGVIANDFMGAMSRSNPANTVTALKALVGWMRDHMPKESYGSYEALEHWATLTESQRKAILIGKQLIYTPKEETWLSIEGKPVPDPSTYDF